MFIFSFFFVKFVIVVCMVLLCVFFYFSFRSSVFFRSSFRFAYVANVFSFCCCVLVYVVLILCMIIVFGVFVLMNVD